MITYDARINDYDYDDATSLNIAPLNVGYQITRRCNLKCVYCSESTYIPDPSFDDIKKGLINLKDSGVVKVNLTGGEPLLRKDIIDIVDIANDLGLKVAIDSNATLMTDTLADKLKDKIVYYEATIDGLPETHEMIRGRYNDVLRGIEKIVEHDIPLYLTMVIIGNRLEDAKHVLSIGHELGAMHVKYLLPIPKARGKNLLPEYLDNPYIKDICAGLATYKTINKLTPSISLTDWKMIGDGAVILINADHMMVGSPVMTSSECIHPLGNILTNPVNELWKEYPYKNNHVKKYVKSMRVK
jgi:MoaA/NifB/PqqE/SkfB family radical SAM enzyme